MMAPPAEISFAKNFYILLFYMTLSINKSNIKKLSFILAFVCVLFALSVFEQSRAAEESFSLSFPSVGLPFGIRVSLGKMSF